MQRLLKSGLVIFYTIFAATAALTLCGIAYLWFGDKQGSDLPYLGWLASILLAEVVGVIFAFVKRGFLYLPEVKTNRNGAETNAFMRSFIANGSTVTIVSNRLAWLASAPEVQEDIVRRASAGVRFEIITSADVDSAQRHPLQDAGVRFYVTGPTHVPEARFTLINGDRSGAERLAIARGTHPHHEITIFDSNSGPQIIGLAKDIIRKSKALIDAA
jgi:hypothetical protein